MSANLEISKELLTVLASISLGAGALAIKSLEKLIDLYTKKSGKSSNETATHPCKQEATIAGISVSVGVYGSRLASVESELAKMREYSREDNKSYYAEFDKLRLAISEVKAIVHSVEITTAQVTTIIKLLEEG